MRKGKENDMTINNNVVDRGYTESIDSGYVNSLTKKTTTAYDSCPNLASMVPVNNTIGDYGNSYYCSERSEDLVQEGDYGSYGTYTNHFIEGGDSSSEDKDSTEEEMELAITIRYFPYMTVQLDTLGDGAYGSVSRRLAIFSETDSEIVACKEISGNPNIKTLSQKALMQEIKIFTSIAHENIIGYLGADAPTKFFMEYASGGTLEKIILDKTIELPFETVVNYALQIARGLEYLHSIGVIHGDLHAENILKAKNDTLKISDLGCASSKKFKQVAKGSPKIFSPERFKGNTLELRKPDDIWAYAHILRELATREKTYPGLKSHEYEKIKAIVIDPKIKLKLPNSVPSRYRFIANICRKHNPDHRLDAPSVVDQLERVEKWYAQNK